LMALLFCAPCTLSFNRECLAGLHHIGGSKYPAHYTVLKQRWGKTVVKGLKMAALYRDGEQRNSNSRAMERENHWLVVCGLDYAWVEIFVF